MKKRFFAALLCLGLLVGLVPGMGTTVFAAGSYSVGDTVEFAGYEWYVIGTETEGVTAPSGCYTLFAKNNDFGDSGFGSSITYKDSDLHSAVEQIASGFSESDKTISLPVKRWTVFRANHQRISFCGRLVRTRRIV